MFTSCGPSLLTRTYCCCMHGCDTARCPGPKCCSLKSASTQTPDPSPNCTSGLPTPPPTPPPRPAPPIPPPAPPNPAAPRPHIVFVLADDLGWYDTAVYNPVSPTPGIAQLAASGIRLDHMCVAPSLCLYTSTALCLCTWHNTALSFCNNVNALQVWPLTLSLRHVTMCCAPFDSGIHVS